MSDPNWLVQIIIGAFLGLMAPYSVRLIQWPFKRLRPHVLKDNWWLYHFSEIESEPKLIESECIISTGLSSKLKFNTKQTQTGLCYKGIVKLEDGSAQFLLVGNSADYHHDEHTIFRFYLPLRSVKNLVGGVHVSYSHDKNPYAATAILSTSQLSPEQAEKELQSRSKRPDGKSMIVVRKTNYKNSEWG